MKQIAAWIAQGRTRKGEAQAAAFPPVPAQDILRQEEGGEGEPPASSPDSPPKSSGPRNPWQVPSNKGPRRGMDDMFRPLGHGTGKGGGGKGGAPKGPQISLPPGMDGRKILPFALAGTVAIWLLLTSGHQLSSNQQGVVTTFGKYTGIIGPGLNITAPWPIQQVSVEDVTSIRRDSVPEGEAEKLMLTSDQSLVDLSYIVRWNIKNLKQFNYQLQDPQGTIIEVAEAAMRASVAEVKLNDVMAGNGRAEIGEHVRQRMQAILDAYHAGVLIQGVDIKKADPPAKVNEAFQKVQAAQQDANRDLSNAQAFAQQVVARAEGDATAFDKVYAQYKLAPEVTRRRMYYATMERVLSSTDKVIAPSGNTTSYLPLPEIRKKAPDAPAQGSNP
ncbi:protease modulator HflK [Novosphingobium umbonatum]|uniref:Protease modulator HflK n=1 Tax=Novosphingobium umbonatum TaxID=1908524 RepID=A0A437NAR6_9SPHN|nr:protease modulator HflK [Novosphingobium umbonatum]RVU07020.1 protease modulator HflK [Novosphingobium umbonatum]